MNRRVGVALVALAVSAGLVLSACDGGEDPTDPPTSETSETSESATPTETETADPTDVPTQPEVEAPTPADEALVDDHVGAIWAVRYFLDLYAYMRQTGDTGQFDAMSASECQFCASAVERATAIHEDDGWVEGGEIVFDVHGATAEYPTDEEPNYLVRFSLTQEPQTITRGDGSIDEVDSASGNGVVALQFVNGRFVVFGVNLE
ncbi:DUF6318 family protein [Pseudactinotalea sp.]|uniref:DUF6318 family protein n=1 Tax=Pseudactinotalea sp. TaxID=1926260 RepID=UPI003B3A7077